MARPRPSTQHSDGHRRPVSRRVLAFGGAVGGALAVAATASAIVALEGRVGPDQALTNSGRALQPHGQLVDLGNFPTGAALTPDGRFYWTVSTGRGRNDIRIVEVASARVVQTLPIPGSSGGIAMDPGGGRAFVSGVADSRHSDQKSPPGTPGASGDAIHVFAYGADGRASFQRVISVPPPGDAAPPQRFPPTNTKRVSWPDRLAVSPDGRRLLVPLNLADAAAVVDLSNDSVRTVKTGSYPYGAAILADGRTGLVSNETPGTVSVVNLDSATKVKDIQVGGHVAHPEAIAVDPGGRRAYVAIANADQVAVIDTGRMEVERTLSVARPEGDGTAPVDVSVTPDGSRLLVAEQGADEIAVFGLPGSRARAGSASRRRAERVLDHEVRAAASRDPEAGDEEEEEEARTRAQRANEDFPLLGRIPTANYPMDVEATPGGADLCGPGAGNTPGADGSTTGTPATGGTPGAAQAGEEARRGTSAGRRRRSSRRRRRAEARAYGRARKLRAKHKAPRRRGRLRGAPASYRTAAQSGSGGTAGGPGGGAAGGGGGGGGGACSKLVWVSAKGLGIGPNPQGPNPYAINDNNTNQFQYTPLVTFGKAGVGDFPSDRQLAELTPRASQQIRPSNAQAAPEGTPLRAGGPIKHVFYIVRENRTYDQVLGDDPRGDGEPGLTLFGPTLTPNMHALAQRFPLLDHVYANSEASIDGHFWTSAAKVSDYVHKNWHQNYAGRERPYDFGVYAVTWPSKGFLFDQAERQSISYFNYGEAVAGVVPLTDKDRDAADNAAVAAKLAKSDLGAPDGCFPNDASIGKSAITGQETWDSSLPSGRPPTEESRFDCFRLRFQAQLLTGTVPSFNYVVLPNDHTEGTTPGRRTIDAMIAENDWALGQFVDLISHSAIWPQSAIFVIEDDSQDGADHVDAHRIPAAVISPYAKRGAVVHTRYDFLSVIRSMELILGMSPLGLFDNLATPMYDAFQPSPNLDPYNVIPPNVDVTARNSASAPNAAYSRSLNLHRTDRAPQRKLDKILWQWRHGKRAEPPPPGPNNSRGG